MYVYYQYATGQNTRNSSITQIIGAATKQSDEKRKGKKKNIGGGQGVKERSVRRGTKKKKEKRSFVSTQMLTKNRHQWNAQRWIAKVRDTGWRLPYWLRQWLRFI